VTTRQKKRPIVKEVKACNIIITGESLLFNIEYNSNRYHDVTSDVHWM